MNTWKKEHNSSKGQDKWSHHKKDVLPLIYICFFVLFFLLCTQSKDTKNSFPCCAHIVGSHKNTIRIQQALFLCVSFMICMFCMSFKKNLTGLNCTQTQKKGQQQHVGTAYTGTRLHGVSQITHEIAGLVFCFIAARQLSQTLQRTQAKHQILSTL